MTKVHRIVCYAVNGSGLGHLTRLIAVGRWLRRYVTIIEDRPPEILFLTSSEASEVLMRAGFASFKIPSKAVARESEIDPLEYRRLAKQFVWQVLGVFNPDLFVVDTFPSGSFDELFQVLDSPFKKGFIFRNVKPDYAARPTFKAAMGLYDAVVVPHSQEASSPGQLAPEISATYSGEVIQFDREELPSKDDSRRELGVSPDHRLVYISAGGGGDSSTEETLISLVETLRDEPDIHLLVGAGPLYRGRRLGGPRLSWLTGPGIFRYFTACDAAISAGGYNTFHELAYVRIPTIFFAQEKIADDQLRRIEAAERIGACMRTADVTDAGDLRERLRKILQPENAASMREACTHVIAENGARRCALSLLRPLYDPSQLAWASELLTPSLVHTLERIGNGSTSVLASWLSPLMPRGRIDTIASHPAFEAVVGRLSPEATREVEQVLAARDDAHDRTTFEKCLIDLIGTVERIGGSPDAVLSTLLAAMKKHPCGQEENGSWVSWVCTLIEEVRKLMEPDDLGLKVPDILQLYRVFPRLVDADIRQSFTLYEAVLRHQISLGRQPHEIMDQIQMIKLANRKVTRSMLEPLSEGAKL